MSKAFIRVADGTMVPENIACDDRGILRDGFRVTFSAMLMDSAPKSIALRDAAGAPVTLHDAATGASLKLNEDLIRAIDAEAAKVGMSAQDYTKEVLRYSHATPTEAL